MIDRFGAVTNHGQPLTVRGPVLEVGDEAPDFELVATNFSRVALADFTGKVRLISVVPSLDTGICDAQTRTGRGVVTPPAGHCAPIPLLPETKPHMRTPWAASAGPTDGNPRASAGQGLPVTGNGLQATALRATPC